MGEYKGGNSKSTVLRQRLPIIILAKAKQSGFGAMQYALPHSGAPGGRAHRCYVPSTIALPVRRFNLSEQSTVGVIKR